MKKLIIILSAILCQAAFGQSFSVFDIDASNFPTVKAKFWAFDAEGNQIIDIDTSDFEIREGDVERKILSVSCPPPQPPKALSAVLTMDISGSMKGKNLENAKAAARIWIKSLPLGKSECAITTFNTLNFFNQDFTTDKQKLLDAIESLSAEGDTDFDAGFINPPACALLAAENGKNERIVVFLTDGVAKGSEQAIISKAKETNVTVYCVTLGFPCPNILKNVAEATGGQCFGNITTKEQAVRVYQMILQTEQGGEPCVIEWKSEIDCEDFRSGNVTCLPLTLGAEFNYTLNDDKIARLKIEPKRVRFGEIEPGESDIATVKITAFLSDFSIIDIYNDKTDLKFEPRSFELAAGDSRVVSATFTRKDDGDAPNKRIVSRVSIEATPCGNFFYAASGTPGIMPGQSSLKLTHPNGGEEFLIGADTIITWEGVLPEDTVKLKYSADAGASWKPITDSAYGLKYKWENIPPPTSDKCLMKVKRKGQPDSILTLRGHKSGALSVAWSPDVSKIASGSFDNSIIIWDAISGKEIKTLEGHSDMVSSVAWSPNGKKIASASKKIKIWGVFMGDEIRTLSGHGGDVTSVAWHPNGDRIASGSADNTIKIWNISTGETIKTLTGHKGVVNCVAWSPNGSKIASASSDKTIKIWRAYTGDEILSFSDGKKVYSVDWSSDGSKIVSGSKGAGIRIWNAELGGQIKKLQNGNVCGVDWSPDGYKIAAGFEDEIIKIWDAVSGDEIRTLRGHTNIVNSVDWSPSGVSVVSGSWDSYVKIWNLEALILHEDVSDSLWSIVAPRASAIDVDMGKVPVGRIKDSIVRAFLTNTGSHPCRIDSIKFEGKDAESFDIISGLPSFVIPNGGSEAVEFRFIPDSVGEHTADIIIYAQYDTLKQTIVGEGVDLLMEVQSNIIDFGRVHVGEKKDTLFVKTIKNVGDSTIFVTSTNYGKPNDEDFSTLSGSAPFYLYPGKTAEMSLRFAPSDEGRTSGTLEFNYNGAGSPAVVQLFGEGYLSPPEILAETEAFPDLICRLSVAKAIKLNNTGEKDLMIDQINLTGADLDEFSINDTTPINIEPDSAKEITVAFSPASTGEKRAKIEIISNANRDSVLFIQMNARKDSVALIPEVKTINLGVLHSNETKDTAISISNAGTIACGGYATTSPNLQLSESGFRLGVNGNLNVSMTFTGLDVQGAFSETLTVYDSICHFSREVRIIGDVRDNPIISAETEAFPDLVCLSNASKTISLSNTGYDDLIIEEINLLGHNVSDFSIDKSTPITIKPGGGEGKTAHFFPSFPGQKSAEIEIISNAVPDSILIIPLSARKDSVALAPGVETIDLGFLCPNETKDTAVNITNVGTIFSGGFAILAANLRTSKAEFALDVGDNYALPITFAGIRDEGAFDEKVTVYDSICGFSREVRIVGEVASPQISAENIKISALIGSFADGKLIIENNSKRDFTIISEPAVSQPFEIIGNPFPIPVPVGGEAKLTIRYTPVDENNDALTLIFNAEPCGTADSVEVVGAPYASEATVQASDCEAYPGDKINVPIILNNKENLQIAGIQNIKIDLRFNRTLLAPTKYSARVIDESSAKITLDDLPAQVSEGDALATVEFDVGLGNTEKCELILSNPETVGGIANITTINGHFKLLGVCREGGKRLFYPSGKVELFNISPNPSDEAIRVKFNLIEKGKTEIRLVNVLGETVKTKTIANPKSGIGEAVFETSDLPQGMHYIILRTPTVVKSTAVQVLK